MRIGGQLEPLLKEWRRIPAKMIRAQVNPRHPQSLKNLQKRKEPLRRSSASREPPVVAWRVTPKVNR
jgi:hypothetical protein